MFDILLVRTLIACAFSIMEYRPFFKKLIVGAEDIQLWFRICAYVKPSLMHRLSNHLRFIVSRERIDIFKILRNGEENGNFIIFHFLGKRSDMDNRLHRLDWIFKCTGFGYGLNWRYFSMLKPTAFTQIYYTLKKVKLMAVIYRWPLTYFVEYIFEPDETKFAAPLTLLSL